MRRRSLTTRLTLSHTLVVLAALALLGAALIALVQRSQREQTINNLTAQAQIYAVYAAELASDTDTLAGIAPSLVGRFALPNGTIVRFFAPNGGVLFASESLGMFPSSAALEYLTNPLPIQPVALERDRRFVAQPIMRGDQTIGVIELSQSTAQEQRLLRQLIGALVQSTLLALIGAAIVGHMLARSLARPLHRLGDVAAAIARGDADVRSDDRSPDEIGRVAQQLNAMADELQARFSEVERLADARQQFYRSVSHELRTPLTAIRGTAENLEDDARPDQQPSLQIIQTEAARLQRLVDELLAPRDSAPTPLRRRQPIVIADLIHEIGQIMRPRAERSGIELWVEATDQIVVAGDRDRLKQALLNLIDNALTWTPPGGSVTLRATRRSDDLEITVSDTGPGIDSAVRGHIWERGVSGSGGQGLGLALVRDVITAHGGSVSISDTAGTTVAVTLPISQAALAPVK